MLHYKIFFTTLGCRLNQIESESIARFFLDESFDVLPETFTLSSEICDSIILCIVNTCAVTEKAEQKARREIRLLLRKCLNASVIITGCYAQIASEKLSLLDKRVCVLKGMLKSRLKDVPKVLKSYLNENSNFDAIYFSSYLSKTLFQDNSFIREKAESAFLFETDTFLSHSRSSIKIQDGCNSNCSYCAIRIARGKSISLPVDEVLKRVNALKNAGQHEVVFTSVNISQYCSEYNGKYFSFADLLEKLLNETTDIFFRISSIYPEIINERFCKIISNDRVRPHFHISVQSGSDKILKLMGRSYKAEDIIKSVNMLRSAKKNAFIACDIIAGFPSESEEDFEKTFSLCKQCNFSYIHTFAFSARENTKAFYMDEKVPQSISKKRVCSLVTLAKEQKSNYIKSCIDKTFRAIAESKIDENTIKAVTENFIHCKIICNDYIPNRRDSIIVKIVSAICENNDDIEAEGILI